MAAPSHLLFSLITLLSLLSISSALPTHTIVNAAEILSDSGYASMALTLDLASHTLFSPTSPSLTVFAPVDAAFSHSGQPPLHLLQYHLLPLSFSLRSLKSLPFGAKISTLLAGQSLTITTLPSDPQVSINNVTITVSPIFDDGSLIIFGIDKFLDPYFRISGPIGSFIPKNLGCFEAAPTRNEAVAVTAAAYPFMEASRVLKSKGSSVMASFLEMQVQGLKFKTMLTVFAPFDQAMVNRTGNLRVSSSIFRRHVIPCRILWSDLVSLSDGMVLRTYLQGFTINITRSDDDVLLVNGVPVILPEMYQNRWLVVHGIREVLEEPSLPQRTEQADQTEPVAAASSDFVHSDPEDESANGHNHFFVFRPV